MNYVEWLRVRGCLKWTALVLVAGVGLVLFARFSYLDVRPGTAGFSSIYIDDNKISDVERNSQRTETRLPDGTTRTVLDNAPLGIRITIDDRGYWGKHVEIFERKAPHGVHANSIDFGDIHGRRFMLPDGGSVVKIDLGSAVPEDFGYYFLVATLVAMIVATILGAPFARENEGHLEIALTKPVSRVELALQTIASDLAGIAAAWAMTVVFLVIGHTIFEAPNYTYTSADTLVLAIGLVGAFAWYALLNAATASMKRSYGGVLGPAWPVALGIGAIANAPLSNSPLAVVVHDVTSALQWLFPTSYLHFVFMSGMGSEEHQRSPIASMPPETTIVVLAVLALVYGASAVYQWQRVEA